MASMVMPEKFSGAEEWEDWVFQFDTVAEINKWPEEQKALYLRLCLVGNALSAFRDLPEESRESYAKAREALGRRFNPREASEREKARFVQRTRNPGEDIAAFATDLGRLARRAYPSWPEDARKTVVRDRFLDGLDSKIRVWVKQARPASLEEAIGVAIEMEAIHFAESSTRGVNALAPATLTREPREIGVESRRCGREDKVEAASWQNSETMREVVELLRQMAVSSGGDRGPAPERRRSNSGVRRRDRLRCWTCGEEGHVRAECPRFSSPGND